MKRSWKLLTLLFAISILASPALQAQATDPSLDPDIHYGGWDEAVQSRNIPAGTVVDPGSQLLYIVDTGINLRTSDFTEEQLAAENVNTLLGVTGASGVGDVQVNFLAITNTHPTQAVTIHFRYFNDECEDLLDFLVLLTCNDTLILNPFDFEIPGTSLIGSPINTGRRIFGPDLSSAFPAIRGDRFASGRFLIFATAAGTTFGDDDQADILFSRELGNGLGGECNIDAQGGSTNFAPGPAGNTSSTASSDSSTRNVGSTAGFSQNNLHVFNATAVSFNYLVGHQTTAVPKGFIEGAQSDQDQFLAYGVNAWTRPAIRINDNTNVEPTIDDNPQTDGSTGLSGDGWFVPDYRILMGSEANVKQSDTSTNITVINEFYLRNDVHGGNTFRAFFNFDTDTLGVGPGTNVDPVAGVGGGSNWGALAWTSIHGISSAAENANQRVEFLSIVDDYDGSKNPGIAVTIGGIQIRDRSYNLTGAETQYIVQVFDNNENQLTVSPETPIGISPAPDVAPTANLRIIVDCLQVWINGVRDPDTRRDGFSIENVGEITSLALDGSGDFAGLNATIDPLEDASQGWIRFVRDNNHQRSATVDDPFDADFDTVTITAGTIAPIDPTIMDNTNVPSFATIGQVVVRFEGFGASWWLASSAFDPDVSEADPAGNPSP
ncbi:MAG: hypothetical protein ACRD1R_17935 [Acidobacteriota bacterium]